MKIIFCDLETTGLDPRRHRIWDAAFVTVDYDGENVEPVEQQWFIDDVDLSTAEEGALRIGHFYERHPNYAVGRERAGSFSSEELAYTVAMITSNCILAGNVINFDASFLTVLLRTFKLAPAWHYHLLDVEAFAAGALGLQPPWDSHTIRDALKVIEPTDRHTALGDALNAQAIYEAALRYRGLAL